MARTTPTAVKKSTARKTTSTPVRNSAIPKKTTARKTVAGLSITQDMIAERAYYIALSGVGSSELDNWHRAERELRGSL